MNEDRKVKPNGDSWKTFVVQLERSRKFPRIEPFDEIKFLHGVSAVLLSILIYLGTMVK